MTSTAPTSDRVTRKANKTAHPGLVDLNPSRRSAEDAKAAKEAEKRRIANEEAKVKAAGRRLAKHEAQARKKMARQDCPSVLSNAVSVPYAQQPPPAEKLGASPQSSRSNPHKEIYAQSQPLPGKAPEEVCAQSQPLRRKTPPGTCPSFKLQLLNVSTVWAHSHSQPATAPTTARANSLTLLSEHFCIPSGPGLTPAAGNYYSDASGDGEDEDLDEGGGGKFDDEASGDGGSQEPGSDQESNDDSEDSGSDGDGDEYNPSAKEDSDDHPSEAELENDEDDTSINDRPIHERRHSSSSFVIPDEVEGTEEVEAQLKRVGKPRRAPRNAGERNEKKRKPLTESPSTSTITKKKAKSTRKTSKKNAKGKAKANENGALRADWSVPPFTLAPRRTTQVVASTTSPFQFPDSSSHSRSRELAIPMGIADVVEQRSPVRPPRVRRIASLSTPPARTNPALVPAVASKGRASMTAAAQVIVTTPSHATPTPNPSVRRHSNNQPTKGLSRTALPMVPLTVTANASSSSRPIQTSPSIQKERQRYMQDQQQASNDSSESLPGGYASSQEAGLDLAERAAMGDQRANKRCSKVPVMVRDPELHPRARNRFLTKENAQRSNGRTNFRELPYYIVELFKDIELRVCDTMAQMDPWQRPTDVQLASWWNEIMPEDWKVSLDVLTREQDQLTEEQKLWPQAKSVMTRAMEQWTANFGKAALNAVKAELRILVPDMDTDKVAEWARLMLGPSDDLADMDRPFLWQSRDTVSSISALVYETSNNGKPVEIRTGLFYGCLVARTLAIHMDTIFKRLRPGDEYEPTTQPRGALMMSIVAVQRALLFWLSGRQKRPSLTQEAAFSKKNWGDSYNPMLNSEGEKVLLFKPRATVFKRKIDDLKESHWECITDEAEKYTKASGTMENMADEAERELQIIQPEDQDHLLYDPLHDL
ncbi:hypothetical protein BDN72DRAFT_906511 [Pluteus cervinus]|uniref:Uncharacterized protein n=1 Tax=Pluteus cervinus TaxID=181527 RepID=A0ACD2ZZ57_9AGAR|nr:hypothetical protein BDN72DRAFT_906511 [Pluteus cervinus]